MRGSFDSIRFDSFVGSFVRIRRRTMPLYSRSKFPSDGCAYNRDELTKIAGNDLPICL